jgi:hypothetical protein
MPREKEKSLLLGASDRIELIATILMAAAAILTAWAAFQSAKWSGIQAIEFSKANAARIESTRLDTRAGQLTSIDVDVFLSWLEAVSSELAEGREVIGDDGSYDPSEGGLSTFYFERMRDEFRPAMDSWLAAQPLTNPDAPATPFATDEYRLEDSIMADSKLDEAGQHTEAALQSNQNSDNHVLTAVALALAIFFGGVSSKLVAHRNRWIAISLAAVIFVGAAITLLILPKVSLF